MKINKYSTGDKAWFIFAGLLGLGLALLFVQEIPSMRREWRMMRM